MSIMSGIGLLLAGIFGPTPFSPRQQWPYSGYGQDGPVVYIQKPPINSQDGNGAGGSPGSQGPRIFSDSPAYRNTVSHPTKAGDKVREPYEEPLDIKTKPVDVDKIDSAIKEELNQRVNRSNSQFRAYVGVAREKNPGINPSVFDDIEKHNKELTPWYVGALASLYKVTPNGDPPAQETLHPKIAQLNERWDYEMRTRVMEDNRKRNPSDTAKADAETNAAFNAVSSELPDSGSGIASVVAKSVYDKDKGGIRLGGVAGAAVGLMLAGVVTGGQGFFGVVAGIIMAAVGAYMGNKFMSSGENPNSPAAHTGDAGEKEKKEVIGKSKELTEDERAAAEAKAKSEADAKAREEANNLRKENESSRSQNMGASDVNIGQVGGLNPPPQMLAEKKTSISAKM